MRLSPAQKTLLLKIHAEPRFTIGSREKASKSFQVLLDQGLVTFKGKATVKGSKTLHGRKIPPQTHWVEVDLTDKALELLGLKEATTTANVGTYEKALGEPLRAPDLLGDYQALLKALRKRRKI